MSLTADEFIPNTHATGSIGRADYSWGEGYFQNLYLDGSAVAKLASPTFTGVPRAPTATPGTSTTQIATTAFVETAIAAAKARSNHTGTQTASTISDFAAAVAATAAGTASHTQNSDTKLAEGTGNEVTAAALRTHLDDATKHRQINDLGSAATDLWSAQKIAAAIAAVEATVPAGPPYTLADITDAGALAALDTIGTAQIDALAVTTAKVVGGEVSPSARKYWGTNGAATVGFHDITAAIALKSVPSSGLGRLELESGELVVSLGTAANRAAAGNDSRFPTADEKAALAGTGGAPGAANKFVTEAGLAEAALLLENLTFTASTELTIAAGVVTRTQSYHTIDTEADAASDNLDTINGGTEGMVMFLRLESNSRAVTVKHGTGNIQCSRNEDIVLSSTTVWAILIYDGTNWLAGYNSTGPGIPDMVSDTTPQFGGMVDVNGFGLGDGTLELLTFTETASAVNHVNITNAATGTGPTVGVAGDDADADLNLAGKGSGSVKVGGNRVLTTGDEGTGNGLDADTLDSYEAAAFALLAGRGGGQILIGGTSASNRLDLTSTSNATKGGIRLTAGDWLELPEISAPGTPSSGFARLYAASDSRLYYVNDAGETVPVLGGDTYGYIFPNHYDFRAEDGPAVDTMLTNGQRVWQFPDGADYSINGRIILPLDMAAGSTLKVKIWWTYTSSSGDVVLGCNNTAAFADGSDASAEPSTYSSTYEVTDTGLGANYQMVTSAITMQNTGQPGQSMTFEVWRNGDIAGDTLATAIQILRVVIQYSKATGSSSGW